MKLNDEQQRLVTDNGGLIDFVLRRYVNVNPKNPLWDDYFQEGFLCLAKAALYFDATKGYRFSTYATHSLINGLRREFCLNLRSGVRGLPRDYNVELPKFFSLTPIDDDHTFDFPSPTPEESADDDAKNDYKRTTDLLNERQAYTLERLRQGDSVKNIAADIGITPQAVSALKRRAIYLIRKHLEEAA